MLYYVVSSLMANFEFDPHICYQHKLLYVTVIARGSFLKFFVGDLIALELYIC